MPLAVSEIAPAEAVAHTAVMLFVVSFPAPIMHETASVIPRAASVVVPAMSSAIGVEESGTAEIEIVAVRIARVDAEMPEPRAPIEGTVEIACRQIRAVLPVEQDIAQVNIAALPVSPVNLVGVVHAQEIIEIHLIGGLILLLGEVKLVCHLVGQEQSLLSSLFVTHGVCRERHSKNGESQQQILLHSLIVFYVGACLRDTSRGWFIMPNVCSMLQNYEFWTTPQRGFPY